MVYAYRSLAIGLVALGIALPKAARAASPHPDPTGFDIPVLPEPAAGFGVELETACNALNTLTVSGGAGVAPAAVASDADIPVGLSAVPGDVGALAKLEGTTSRLKVVCKAIDVGAPPLSPPDLITLRAFRDSGSMPSLAAALAKSLPGPGVTPAALATKIREAEDKTAGDLPAPTAVGFESNLLNGLADFLVTRSKEEAILYLQDQIASRYCTADGKKVLPNTCEAITGLDSRLSIAAIGASLNAAARRDLVQLPNGILLIAADKDAQNFYLYESLRLIYSVVLDVHRGRLPQEVVRSLYALPLRACEEQAAATGADRECQNVLKAVRVSSALVYAAQANSIDQVYANLGTRRVRVVGTLLEAEMRYNTPFNAVPKADPRRLEVTPAQLNQLNGVLTGLGEVLKQWKQHQAALTAPADAKSTPADRKRVLGTAMFDTMIRVSQTVTKVAPMVVTTPATLATVLDSMVVVRDSASIGRDAVTEDYGSIPLDAGNLLTHLKATKLPDAVVATIKEAQKFLPIVTELASAKSSGDVAGALSAAGAPADSYRAKYQRPTLAINALVGAFIGGESPNDPNNGALGKAKKSAAFAGFAPVGVEGTVPFGDYAYGGLMLSVIDIGTLTTARFRSEISDAPNVTATSDVTISQVFSPGVYLMLGLGKSPIVLGGGASFAPNLRTLEATDAGGAVIAKETVSALRYGGFLAMDVSILSL